MESIQVKEDKEKRLESNPPMDPCHISLVKETK